MGGILPPSPPINSMVSRSVMIKLGVLTGLGDFEKNLQAKVANFCQFYVFHMNAATSFGQIFQIYTVYFKIMLLKRCF